MGTSPPSDSGAHAPNPLKATQRRLTTLFGWLAGASLGLILNYVAFLAFGASYPITPTTFGAVILGCFGGMALADRLGPRGFRPLGIGAGIMVALALSLICFVAFSQ